MMSWPSLASRGSRSRVELTHWVGTELPGTGEAMDDVLATGWDGGECPGNTQVGSGSETRDASGFIPLFNRLRVFVPKYFFPGPQEIFQDGPHGSAARAARNGQNSLHHGGFNRVENCSQDSPLKGQVYFTYTVNNCLTCGRFMLESFLHSHLSGIAYWLCPPRACGFDRLRLLEKRML